MSAPDTIYALASGAGKAGVAVIRISGPGCRHVIDVLTPLKKIKPRYAHLTTLQFQEKKLDQAVVLFFEGPASFTGEDVLELHAHGGTGVLTSIFEALAKISGCRPAQAGEFSRRAVLNGKMDLTQAEGIMDLVNAETEAGRKQALRQVSGELKELLDSWRAQLVRIGGFLEAFIDFPEEDIPSEKEQIIEDKLAELQTAILDYLDDHQGAQRLHDGFKIVLCGHTNVGKSSLLNTLMKREMALVSSIPGTTRDVVEGHLDIDGFPVILSDTAGLRASGGVLERRGIDRAKKEIQDADLVLHLVEAKTYPKVEELPVKADLMLTVWTKADLPNTVPADALKISTKTGEGVRALLHQISQILKRHYGTQSLLTRQRYRVALTDCAAALGRALKNNVLELKAEDIRLAAKAIGRITGQIETEELLDVIFKEFCIGK